MVQGVQVDSQLDMGIVAARVLLHSLPALVQLCICPLPAVLWQDQGSDSDLASISRLVRSAQSDLPTAAVLASAQQAYLVWLGLRAGQGQQHQQGCTAAQGPSALQLAGCHHT